LSAVLGFSDQIRDEAALEQALHFPESTFNGALVHSDVFAATAAYMWYLVQNRPFIEGNRAVAAMAGYVFAVSNGVFWEIEPSVVCQLLDGVSDSLLGKQELVEFMRDALSFE
jgi:death-on-curing protein